MTGPVTIEARHLEIGDELADLDGAFPSAPIVDITTDGDGGIEVWTTVTEYYGLHVPTITLSEGDRVKVWRGAAA
jgi:hypothetical protein